MNDTSDTYPANQTRIEKQKELLIDQLKKTPVVEVACQKVGVSRTTFYRWRRDDKDFHEKVVAAVDQGTELVNDLAESKLIGQVQNGHFGSIKFWLQNHHQTYRNKLEISAEKTQELTDDEKKRLEQAYQRLGLNSPKNKSAYDKSTHAGSADNGPDPHKPDSEAGSGEEIA